MARLLYVRPRDVCAIQAQLGPYPSHQRPLLALHLNIVHTGELMLTEDTGPSSVLIFHLFQDVPQEVLASLLAICG